MKTQSIRVFTKARHLSQPTLKTAIKRGGQRVNLIGCFFAVELTCEMIDGFNQSGLNLIFKVAQLRPLYCLIQVAIHLLGVGGCVGVSVGLTC